MLTVPLSSIVGATFLKQRATQMRARSKRPRVESSSVAPPPPFSTGDTTTEESVDPTVAEESVDTTIG